MWNVNLLIVGVSSSLPVSVAVVMASAPAASAASVPSDMSVRRGGLYGENSTAADGDTNGRPPGTNIASSSVILTAMFVLAT